MEEVEVEYDGQFTTYLAHAGHIHYFNKLGNGDGREPAIRALAGTAMRIISLKDITPVPHNGCRPPERRRI